MNSPYQPPDADLRTPAMGGPYTAHVPGVRGTLSVSPPSMWTAPKLLLDGAPLKRSWGKFIVPLEAGGTAVARVQDWGTGLELRLGAQKIPVGPQLHGAWVLLICAPFGCAALGGAIGGGLGGAAWAVNRALARTRMAGPLKAALMLGVTALAMVLTLVAAGALRVLIASHSA
jgi:hypothetical protein